MCNFSINFFCTYFHLFCFSLPFAFNGNEFETNKIAFAYSAGTDRKLETERKLRDVCYINEERKEEKTWGEIETEREREKENRIR